MLNVDSISEIAYHIAVAEDDTISKNDVTIFCDKYFSDDSCVLGT